MRAERLRILLRNRFSREGAVGLYFTIGFAACALIVLLFGSLARQALGEELVALDSEATLAVRQWHTPGLDRLLRTVTFFGDHVFLLPATAAVVGALVWKGHRVSAILFAGSVFGGFALNSLLKLSLARPRPDLWPPLVTERTFSFPSGHAAMATVFFGGLAAVILHLTRRRDIRLLSLLGAAAAIAAIAGSRVYLGAHWITDVVAGVLVGFFWVVVGATGTEFFARRTARRSENRVAQ